MNGQGRSVLAFAAKPFKWERAASFKTLALSLGGGGAYTVWLGHDRGVKHHTHNPLHSLTLSRNKYCPTPPRCPPLPQAVQGDFLSRISERAGVALERLVADNLNMIKDLDVPLAGKTLIVCGAKGPNSPAATSPPAPAALPASVSASLASQMQALLQVKAAVDKKGVLNTWTTALGTNGGYCSQFVGVTCDEMQFVTNISLTRGNSGIMGGTLPPASSFMALPRLKSILFYELDITGTLPADYGNLTQLQVIHVEGNPTLTGPLPREWAGLARLEVLHLP